VLRVLTHHVEVLLRHPDEHQIGERLFAIGVLSQDVLIDLRGLIQMPQRRQRDRLAEQRVRVRGVQFQAAFETEERAFGIFLTQMADPQAEMRIHVLGCQRAGLVERLRGVFPRAVALQAHGQIEPAHRVLRLDLHQRAITLRRFLKHAEFKVDVAHRAVDLRRSLIGCDGPLQLSKCLLPLAGEVEGDGSRQMALRAGAFIIRVDFHVAQSLNLGGGAHGNGAHCTVYSLLGAAEVTLTQ